MVLGRSNPTATDQSSEGRDVGTGGLWVTRVWYRQGNPALPWREIKAQRGCVAYDFLPINYLLLSGYIYLNILLDLLLSVIMSILCIRDG